MADDVFSALSKYKKPENYLTAAFLYVLESLWLKYETRPACCEILAELFGIKFLPNEKILFKTQRYAKARGKGKIESEKSTLDAEIASDDKCIWIEVKDKSKHDEKQLQKYKQELDKLPFKTKQLIFLSHNSVGTAKAYKTICWYEVYDSLREKLDSRPELRSNDGESHYLLTQFLEFLDQKGVQIMGIINEDDLKNGLRQLQSLLNMLKEEVRGRLLPDVPKAGENLNLYYMEDYIGFSFGQNRYSVDIPLEEHKLANYFILSMDKNKVEKIEQRRIRSNILQKKIREERLGEEDGDIYARRDLSSVFQVATKDKQKFILGELLQEMWDELKEVKAKK